MTGAWLRRGRTLAVRHGRPLRFIVAGMINTGFGFALYPALLWASAWLHRHYLVGLGLAQLVCLCVAFATYRIAVYDDTGPAGVARQIGLFSSFYLAGYAVNWAALPLLVSGLRVDPIVAQIGISLLLMIGSYFWHSRLTFGPARENR